MVGDSVTASSAGSVQPATTATGNGEDGVDAAVIDQIISFAVNQMPEAYDFSAEFRKMMFEVEDE